MRVSALTIIHNRADLFADTIRSVLEQSYPVHELIVIDDGSTEQVKAVTDAFPDERIKYYYYPHTGIISKLRNRAIEKSTGDVAAFIDSDDLWHQDKIKMHVEAMQQHNADMVLSDCQQFNSEGLIYPSACQGLREHETDVFRQLIDQNLSLAFGTNLFFKKIIQDRAVRFDESLFVGEHDLVLRLSASHKVVFIGTVLNYIRRHNRNTTVPGHITDLICPLEYNRTLDKLRRAERINAPTYNKVKAANYSKVGGYYLHRKRYWASRRYFCAALQLDPGFYYARLLLKTLWRR